MDQQRIGAFLKELRNENNFTQEQLAEKFGVSRRTVSRWETGYNMPDLGLLVELADFYDVELRELLDGERKGVNMEKELEETVFKVADYSNEHTLKLIKMLQCYFIVGCVLFIGHILLIAFRPEQTGFVYGILEGGTIGIPVVTVFVGTYLTSKYIAKARKSREKLEERNR